MPEASPSPGWGLLVRSDLGVIQRAILHGVEHGSRADEDRKTPAAFRDLMSRPSFWRRVSRRLQHHAAHPLTGDGSGQIAALHLAGTGNAVPSARGVAG